MALSNSEAYSKAVTNQMPPITDNVSLLLFLPNFEHAVPLVDEMQALGENTDFRKQFFHDLKNQRAAWISVIQERHAQAGLSSCLEKYPVTGRL